MSKKNVGFGSEVYDLDGSAEIFVLNQLSGIPADRGGISGMGLWATGNILWLWFWFYDYDYDFMIMIILITSIMISRFYGQMIMITLIIAINICTHYYGIYYGIMNHYYYYYYYYYHLWLCLWLLCLSLS